MINYISLEIRYITAGRAFKYDVVISSSDMMPPKLFAGFEAPYCCQEGKPAVVAKVMALAGKPLTSSLLYSSIML